MTSHLSNGLLTARFDGDLALPVVERLFRFLHPYFRKTNAADHEIRFEIGPFCARPKKHESVLGMERQFRKSSAKPFNLWIRKGVTSNGAIVGQDDRTQTAYEFISPFHVALWVSDQSLYHLIELFRYSALTLMQRAGIVVLHASAVKLGNSVILITGEKGTGKTTMLIHLVKNSGGQIFSGDKVLLFEQHGRAFVMGWPDFPHIGGGTLSGFADLSVQLGLAEQDRSIPERAKVKHLFDPHTFYRVLGEPHAEALPVRAIIFPNVAAQTGFERLDDHEVADRLAPNIEHSVQYTVLDWHGFGGNRGINDTAQMLSLLSREVGLRYDGRPRGTEWLSALG
ncbi:hypothetical protein [Erythrobacter sp.]|uniref:hypothetical protein n=1 Tax=Erythrobacter sp. TaxID=1042 RepID=UPI003C75728A